MQIDWISAITATPPELWPGYTSGQRLKVDPDGQVVEVKPSMHQVEDADPSSSRNFTVWTPNPGTLYLSGNPVKLLQGHNLWGSLDAFGLYFEAGSFIRQHAGLFPGPNTWEACQFTAPRFTRLDLTRSYRFASQGEADDYIRYIAGNARSRHGAATLVGGTTAYFGQHSRRWTLKVYAKWHEIVQEVRKHARSTFSRRGHQVPAELADWARGVVRFEFTLRGPELEDVPASDLASPEYLRSLWQQYFDRITMTENTTMNTASPLLEADINPRLRGVLALWRTGEDLRRVYPKVTFYRYRKELIDCLGIDINVPPAPDAPATVRAVLDPAGWDPEPIQARSVDPRPELKAQYRLV
ncbi:MAG: hypothetical protein KGL17_07450 [Betaproteobacteria bacterium]|nr:hypothetical protein [Betaproteobacteria bacterium]